MTDDDYDDGLGGCLPVPARDVQRNQEPHFGCRFFSQKPHQITENRSNTPHRVGTVADFELLSSPE